MTKVSQHWIDQLVGSEAQQKLELASNKKTITEIEK